MDILQVIAIATIVPIGSACASLVFGKSQTLQGIAIPVAGGKSYLQKNLDFSGSSSYYSIIDIDTKLNDSGDSDSISHSELNAPLFTKGKEYVNSSIDILKKCSANSKNQLPIIASRNFKMLKYIGESNVKVNYFLGSQAYYDEIKLTAEDAKKLQEYKDFLQVNGKMSKVISYNSKEELLSKVCALYGLSPKK